MGNKIKHKIVNFAVTRHYLCLSIALILFLMSLPFLSDIKLDFSAKAWFRANDQNIKTLEYFEKTFGNDEVVNLIIETDEDFFNPKSIKLLNDLTEQMWKVPEVIRVQSLVNFYWSRAEEDEIITEEFLDFERLGDTEYLKIAKERALSHKVIPNYFISKDGKSASIFGFIAHNPDKAPDYELITKSVEQMLEKYETIGKVKFHLLGQPPLSHRFQAVSFSDLETMAPLLMLLVVLYLIYCFRTFVGVAIPTIIIILSLVTNCALIGLLGLSINSLTFVLPSVLIAISIADSVHLLATFYDEFSKTGDKLHSCYYSLSKNFWAVILTSLSTMIGFFSLTVSEIKPVAELGLLAGIGTFQAMLFSYLTVIPLLKIFNNEKTHENLNAKMLPEQKVRSYLRFIRKYRKLVISLSIALTILFSWLAVNNTIDSNPYKYFVSNDPISISNQYVLNAYGGVGGPEIIVDSGIKDGIKDPLFLKKVDEFQTWLESQDDVNKVISVINIIKEMNQSLNQGLSEHYLIPDKRDIIAQELFLYTMSLPVGEDLNNRMDLEQRRMRMTVLWSKQSSKRSLEGVEAYELKAKELGLNISTTGKPVLFHRMNSYVVYTFFSSIAMALVLITLILILVFKDIKLGLLSIIPNIVPVIFGAGALTILNKPIDIGCAIVASVTLGIAVDDTIHFLSHFNTLRKKGMNTFESMVTVFTSTGLALLVTTLILVSCFGLFMFANLMPNINFGILCALVLTIALACDLIVLPAIVFSINTKEYSES
ncbi:RND family transporter [Halobacteriovorax sp. HLS]|uniref:efflux RND transporter permease subunit n=1 Tax=Halobacteriovorax sp. HLS TaxID=2234000 RepID=UPI000FDCA9F8|nr:MMPL family transporter [Halobacteriovorax sp. HLS]